MRLEIAHEIHLVNTLKPNHGLTVGRTVFWNEMALKVCLLAAHKSLTVLALKAPLLTPKELHRGEPQKHGAEGIPLLGALPNGSKCSDCRGGLSPPVLPRFNEIRAGIA